MKELIDKLALKLHIQVLSLEHILAGFILAGLLSLIFWDLSLGFIITLFVSFVKEFVKAIIGRPFSFKLFLLVGLGALPFFIIAMLVYYI